jgi:hypothetical protein
MDRRCRFNREDAVGPERRQAVGIADQERPLNLKHRRIVRVLRLRNPDIPHIVCDKGLGLTGFYNYGYGNITPDSENLATPLKGSNAHFTRMAGIVSYAAEQWNALGEFDYGQNAFTLGTLFRGSGPQDAFGIPTGTAITKGPFAGNKTCTTDR